MLVKNLAYDHGFFKAAHLRAPVVSIGNLSTGGGGKTPFVIALAKLLTEAGIPVDVLSRGYGRSSGAVELVDPSAGSTAEQFGDEPLMIARATGVPVYVAARRYDAGLLAERNGLRIHLLDDGFQHRQLARDLDIVMMHREDLSASMLPAGHLREPWSALCRADVLVLREEDRALLSRAQTYLKPSAAVWYIRRTLDEPGFEGKALAFCGIARPQEFFTDLRTRNVALSDTIAFADHHRYSEQDLARLCDRARVTGADRFLTTVKDQVRLTAAQLGFLAECRPVEAVPLRVHLLEPSAVLEKFKNLRLR